MLLLKQEIFQVDVIQSYLVERIFHMILNIVERNQDKAMNYAQTVNHPGFTRLHVIDQGRYEYKREHVDKHQAIGAKAYRRSMGFYADGVLHALFKVLQKTNDFQCRSARNRILVVLNQFEQRCKILADLFRLIMVTPQRVQEKSGYFLQALGDVLLLGVIKLVDIGKASIHRSQRRFEHAQEFNYLVPATERLSDGKNQWKNDSNAEQGNIEVKTEIEPDTQVSYPETNDQNKAGFIIDYGQVFLHVDKSEVCSHLHSCGCCHNWERIHSNESLLKVPISENQVRLPLETFMTRQLILLMACLMPALGVNGAEIAPLFASDEVLDITLTAPFRQIDRERDKEQEYEGFVSYSDADGSDVQLDARFEVRGNYRLRSDVCRYSQLWVDLRRRQVSDTLFEGQNRLKLVVQCRQQSSYSDYIIKEFLAYQMFNRLTSTGFGTRLVNVTYDYSDDEGESRTHLGLLVENKDTVAEREGATNVELNRVNLALLEPKQSTLVALFMLMIGNTDFSLAAGPEGDECCHNAKLLDVNGSYIPIPYDFDGSGFVNASYAADPNPSFGIRNNRQRLFRGYCIHNDHVESTIPVFLQAQQEIFTLVEESAIESGRGKQAAVGYLEDFFELISDPGEIEDEIFDECRG